MSQDSAAAVLLSRSKEPLFCRMLALGTCLLTRELGLSSTTKMTKMLAFWAFWTAARTLSLPSRKRPRPSETMRSSWAVSAEAVHYRGKGKGKTHVNNWKPSVGVLKTDPGNRHILNRRDKTLNWSAEQTEGQV